MMKRHFNQKILWIPNILWAAVLLAGLSAAGGCATSGAYKSESSLVYEKGMRLYNSGHYEQAKEVFHEYIENFPESTLYRVVLYDLGHCYQELGDYKQAQLIYHKVINQSDADDFWSESSKRRLDQIQELMKRQPD